MLATWLLWATGVVRSSSTRGLEMQNGCAALLSGIVLILPLQTFATSPSYSLFAAWAPEPIWGVSFLGAGAAQIAAALYDQVVMRRIAAVILGVLFAVIGAGIMLVNPPSAVAPILLVLALGQLGAFWQARRRP